SLVGKSPETIKYGFKFIEACVAGSAYYLLLILNLSTPKIQLKTRIKAIFFSFAAFFIINLIRVIILVLVFFTSPDSFVLTHKLFWYALSTLFVVLIWIAETKIFQIKAIPIYSDIVSLKKISILKN
ncbi:MAG: pacearchaeosortase, partial [Nanoarchaeota archaeon]